MSEVKAKKAPRAKKPAVKPVPEPVVVELLVEPEPEPEPEPVAPAELELEREDTEPADEGAVAPKKKKVGKKVKKQQIFVHINEDLDKLIESIKKDLASGKLDKLGEKLLKRYLKELVRINNLTDRIQKKPGAEPRNSQSGFSKPCLITDDLAHFAGWEVGSMKSRIEVNNVLCTYIKAHNLQLETDKRIIIPDDNLAGLLKYNKEQHGKLDFAEMQRFISNLLVKN